MHATSAETFSSDIKSLQGSDGSEEEDDRDDDPPAELARLRDVRPPAAPGRGEGGLPRADRGGGDILHGKIRTSFPSLIEENNKNMLQSAGFPCPKNHNPAEHYLKVLAIAPGEEACCRHRVGEICHKFDQSDPGKSFDYIIFSY